jgi:predicted RNase H-like HicB family nuclease
MKTKKVLQYKVIIEKGLDGYFVARVPALPGCLTQAKTYEALIPRVKEAIQLCHEVAEQDKNYRQKIHSLFHRPAFIGIEEVAVAV